MRGEDYFESASRVVGRGEDGFRGVVSIGY